MKRLGQHFLKNKNKIKKIIAALELKEGDTIIEIGPGHGELTKEIIERLKDLKFKRLIAIEKDKCLAEILRKTIETDRNSIEIIEGDVLKILPSFIRNLSAGGGSAFGGKLEIRNSGYKIAGNIPYYITGRLFRIIGELKPKPTIIVLTIQKEVAERIVAKPPRMNLLAASIQFWAEPKIIDFISKKDFRPPPEVDSAIIKLTSKPKTTQKSEEISQKYYQLIKILFKQPRKTILNNLLSGPKHKREQIIKKLAKIGINPQNRAQNLRLDELKKLALIVYN